VADPLVRPDRFALAVLLVVAFAVIGATRQQTDACGRLAGVADGSWSPSRQRAWIRTRAGWWYPLGAPHTWSCVWRPRLEKAWEAWGAETGHRGAVVLPAGVYAREDLATPSPAPSGALSDKVKRSHSNPPRDRPQPRPTLGGRDQIPSATSTGLVQICDIFDGYSIRARLV